MLPEANRSKLKKITQNILTSLDSNSVIEVVDSQPLDRFQVRKAAVFFKEPLHILLHKGSWVDFSPSQKVALIGMELLGLIDLMEQRYLKVMSNLALNSVAVAEIIQSEQSEDIIRFFARESNKKKSSIFNDLNVARNYMKDGLNSPENIIPFNLKTSDITAVHTYTYDYSRFDGDEEKSEISGAYLTKYEIFIKIKQLSYSGLIKETHTIRFECTWQIKDLTNPKHKISCKKINRKE